MIWRIEVGEKRAFFDAVGESVRRDIEELGFKGRVKEVRAVQVYLLEGDIDTDAAERICSDLLADPITQDYSCAGSVCDEKGYKAVEVAYNAGVMDPVEESARKAIIDLGISGISRVKTARRYLIRSDLSDDEIRSVAQRVLHNKLIQHIAQGRPAAFPEPPSYRFKLTNIDLLKSGDKELTHISRKGQLFLSVEEMRAIRNYFRKLGRNPTDCELETLAQTWSEHCKHKTFRGRIEYREKTPNTKLKTKKINNLLKSTIMKVTDELKKPWCVSVFHDNSGVIRFDDRYNICFKVETHNHPSALEPYGGAGTGIGGVIRDPLGTGLGAKPIMNTDVFCFGPPDYPYAKLPKGALHPKRVMKGVVAGVRDYGNRMGIPTSNGAVLFDKNFIGNPLVFCGNVGLIPKEKSFKHVKKGDLAVLVGGRTGRDGIHGATFSSGELTIDSEAVSGSAVQIGNPIQEKKMTDAVLAARDKGLYNAITDCGGGGLSSAVGEMGEELGVDVWLEKVPLKYNGLSYTEIWISEAQERMILAVGPENIDRLTDIFEKENVDITVIGRFTGTKRLCLFYAGTPVCDLDMDFLHGGLPPIVRKAVWKAPRFPEPRKKAGKDLTGELLGLLSSLNIASKEWIIRQYDHEVQGGSVIKPLQGAANDGPGDACVTRPLLNSKKGVVVGCGINADYGRIDPYWMAASAIDEALRQIVAVGADITRCAILDNFCWGNTDKEDRLGGLVRAARACYDIARAYGVPFISGKDSLNNEYFDGKKSIPIPPTLLISAIAVMDDISRAITMDFKKPGNAVYLIGLTHDELGGSQYYKNTGFIGNGVPKVSARYGRRLMSTLAAAIRKGLIRSCHDCSDGGLAVAVAESAFAGGHGAEIRFSAFKPPRGQKRLPDDVILFSESNTRFLVEVRDEKRFAAAMKGMPIWKLGLVTEEKALRIYGSADKPVISAGIDDLKKAWQRPFKDL